MRRFLLNSLILTGLLALVMLPTSLVGWFDLHKAQSAKAAGRYAEAAVSYRSAATRLFWRRDLWEQAGQAALSGNDPDAAILALSRAILSPEGWLALGDAYLQKGDRLAAMEAWQGALPSAGAYARLADGYLALGNYAAAIANLRSLIALKPENAGAHYQLGLLLMASRPDEALPELMSAANLDPQLDTPVQALRAALNTAFLVDDRAYRLVMAGRALASLEEWHLAARAFGGAAQARSDYAEAWIWLGEARQHLGQDGLQYLHRAVALDPSSSAAHAFLGLYWQRQGQAEQALAEYLQAGRLDPENPAWQAALGEAYARSGDLVAALGYYRRAAELAPEDAVYWRTLAAFCVEYNVDLTATGLPAALQALALAPDDWQSLDVIGQVTLARGGFDSAADYFLEASRAAPNAAAPHLHLGRLYLETGERAAAYDHLVIAHRLDPDGSIGDLAQRLLEQYFP